MKVWEYIFLYIGKAINGYAVLDLGVSWLNKLQKYCEAKVLKEVRKAGEKKIVNKINT